MVKTGLHACCPVKHTATLLTDIADRRAICTRPLQTCMLVDVHAMSESVGGTAGHTRLCKRARCRPQLQHCCHYRIRRPVRLHTQGLAESQAAHMHETQHHSIRATSSIGVSLCLLISSAEAAYPAVPGRVAPRPSQAATRTRAVSLYDILQLLTQQPLAAALSLRCAHARFEGVISLLSVGLHTAWQFAPTTCTGAAFSNA